MEHFLAFLRYGNDFRISRRLISQYFNSREYVYLYPLLADQVKILLKNLLEDPDKFESHLDRSVIADLRLVCYLLYNKVERCHSC